MTDQHKFMIMTKVVCWLLSVLFNVLCYSLRFLRLCKSCRTVETTSVRWRTMLHSFNVIIGKWTWNLLLRGKSYVQSGTTTVLEKQDRNYPHNWGASLSEWDKKYGKMCAPTRTGTEKREIEGAIKSRRKDFQWQTELKLRTENNWYLLQTEHKARS